MLDRMRQRTADEGGFTLIELLVVVLIIGILAAIAIPAFLSQTSKASDSGAKTQVGTLQTTMETFASENNGSYESATLANLQEIEPTLKDTSQATPEVGELGRRRIRSQVDLGRHERRIQTEEQSRRNHKDLQSRKHRLAGWL